MFCLSILLSACGTPAKDESPESVSSSSLSSSGLLAAEHSSLRSIEPAPNALVTSPLTVRGEARGTWYFEASFPVRLLDSNNQELATVPAQAQGEWMTTDFVPFEANLTFTTSTSTGTLVLEKDNPSGLPENADELRIPVRFK